MKQVHKQRGFSLIELIIVVAIIGIIATFAVPTYLNARIKAEREVAHGKMIEVAQALERFKTLKFAYTTSFTKLGYGPPAASYAVAGTDFQLTITITAAPPTYTITATSLTGRDKLQPKLTHTGDYTEYPPDVSDVSDGS